jgi:DNA processing protein
MIDLRDLLRLSSVPRIGPQKVRALIARFKTPGDVFSASARELTSVPGIDKKLASNILHHSTGGKFADEQLARLHHTGARIVTLWDREYPDLLRKIYDPPAFVFVLGKFKDTDTHSIALVGTRHPSPYGHAVTEDLVRDFARHGVTIVSGLARGIDTIAHNAALRCRTRTIAVIGSGLDVPYPPENRKLMERIADECAVVSEFPLGTKPDAPNFPRRNRIISGLSIGTIVIESAEDGGAMITASMALDQNRETFAVPGNITEKRSAGPNTLIRDGHAKLITSAQDVFLELSSQLHFEYREKREPAVELTSAERSIVNLLSAKPLYIDLIAEQMSMATSDALVILLSLEFKGVVRQLPGKYFVKS